MWEAVDGWPVDKVGSCGKPVFVGLICYLLTPTSRRIGRALAAGEAAPSLGLEEPDASAVELSAGRATGA
jgi:hypothetical protein